MLYRPVGDVRLEVNDVFLPDPRNTSRKVGGCGLAPYATAAWLGRARPGGGASASAETRAYRASDPTDVCPDRAISIGVAAPASASWVRALCRSRARSRPREASENRAAACW